MQRTLMLQDFTGRPNRPSKPAAGAGADADDRSNCRPWHRRDDGDFQRRQCRTAPAAPVRRARSSRTYLHRRPSVQIPVLGRRLPGASGAADTLRTDCHVHGPDDDVQRWRCGGSPARTSGLVDVLRACSGSNRSSGATSRRLDGQPGSPAAVIVSHGFWQQRLGARPEAIGRPIRLDGSDYTLAGVLPPQMGPLEKQTGLLRRPAVHDAAAPRSVSLHRARPASQRRGTGRQRQESCARSTGASFRSGRRPTRTTRRRGA